MGARRENTKPSFIRRVLACLVSAAMVVAFTPVVAWGGETNTYYVAPGSTTPTTVSNATVVESSESAVTWNDGWYVVQDSTVTISQRVTVEGNVHLILKDDCALTVNGGIQVEGSNRLTIYGQTLSTGTLIADANSTDNAGIGGASSTVAIIGGTVTATGGTGGAGIGGASSTVAISGGTVTATGGTGGAGIGGIFKTESNGNAVIFASSISNRGNQSSWSGMIFEGDSSENNKPVFYGTSVTPTDSFTIFRE